MRIASVIKAIEDFASPSLQEKWDNTGLQVGSPLVECTGVLVCLDATPAVVEEAIALGCNLIVTHHPLFFKPVKRLTGSTLVESTAMAAIQAGIAIYSTHTACDSTKGGVSYEMARLLGVTPLKTLAPVEGYLTKLQVIAPSSHAEAVRLALYDAGAGAIGNYDCCSFNILGEGTFRPLSGSNPFTGKEGELHQDEEVAIEVVLPSSIIGKVEAALLEVHPYETPAYSFTPMLNSMKDLGLGIYGVMESELTPTQFVEHVKNTFGCKAVRTSKCGLDADAKIRRVALCGGAGGEFIGKAIAMGAQAYVTADIRYHDFVDYRDQILVIDAGHYDTEAPIKEVLKKVVSAKFPTIPAYCTSTEDNPINYL